MKMVVWGGGGQATPPTMDSALSLGTNHDIHQKATALPST